MSNSFNDRSFDRRLLELLGQNLGADDILSFVDKLDTDAKFREQFADWIKSFRDPGHRSLPAERDPRGSS